MASTGLKKWFKEKWVDIGRPKRKENINPVVEEKRKLLAKATLNVYL